MAHWEVNTVEETGWKYLVEADSAQEARDKALRGETLDSENMGSDGVEVVEVERIGDS